MVSADSSERVSLGRTGELRGVGHGWGKTKALGREETQETGCPKNFGSGPARASVSRGLALSESLAPSAYFPPSQEEELRPRRGCKWRLCQLCWLPVFRLGG